MQTKGMSMGLALTLLLCLLWGTNQGVSAVQNCTAAPPSKLCRFPASGNIQYLISGEDYALCSEYNEPPKLTSKRLEEAGYPRCVLSEECLGYLGQYLCSGFCSRCVAEDQSAPKKLPPCKDFCQHYTRCRGELADPDCLPENPPFACADVYSNATGSEQQCTVLSVEEANLPELTLSPASTLHARHSSFLLSTLLSIFFSL
ncbi:hypothetical protein QOT17_011439 [Balamuthia mandrillaris]